MFERDSNQERQADQHAARHQEQGTATSRSIERVASLTARLRVAILLLLLVISGGTLGYVLIEGWTLGEGLYMTVITVTTVGYREVRELTGWGQLWTGIILFAGLGVLLYVLSAIVEVVVETQVSGLLGRRRMERQIERLQDHYIICGYGRMGQAVARQLLQEGCQLVVIDSNLDVIEAARQHNLPVVAGDATNDEVLVQAGVRRARCLLATADSDAANLFVTVSARALNAEMEIIARVSSATNAGKLRRAGANHAISPYELGGLRMATLATRPGVASYIDSLLHDADHAFNLGEINIAASGVLRDLMTRVPHPPAVLAVHRGKELIANPSADTTIQLGDSLILVGTTEQLYALDATLGDASHTEGEWQRRLGRK